MLDTTLPYKPVLMTHPSPKDAPRFPIPDGFSLQSWTPGREADWCEIEAACGEFPSAEAAMAHFSKEFLPYADKLLGRMQFLLAPDGRAAGTATLWQGKHLGGEKPRIHWVGVHPDFQRRGAARGLLSAVMEAFGRPGAENFAYLTTQTWSWPAIRLYRQMGFVPEYALPAYWKEEWDPEGAWALIDWACAEAGSGEAGSGGAGSGRAGS